MFWKVIDNICKKNWSTEDIKKYLGRFQKTYLAFSLDESIRKKAASGGVTTALLCFALEEKLIDGALVCKTVIKSGKVRTRFFIATSREDLLQSQGSKYISTSFSKEATRLIKGFDGKLAVTGLPCDIGYLSKKEKVSSEFAGKIVLKLALFCGHSSKPELIDKIIQRIKPTPEAQLIGFNFRVGHWRGCLEADYEGGMTVRLPSNYFTLYQNLYFFCDKKCLACFDHFGYESDISLGDTWLYQLKDKDKKYNSLIARHREAINFLHRATGAGYIELQETTPDRILDGQSRTAPFHYNVTARHKAGNLLSISLPELLNEPVKWHHYFSALIVLFNYKLSQSNSSKKIWMLPRPLLKTLLVIKKGIDTLK